MVEMDSDLNHRGSKKRYRDHQYEDDEEANMATAGDVEAYFEKMGGARNCEAQTEGLPIKVGPVIKRVTRLQTANELKESNPNVEPTTAKNSDEGKNEEMLSPQQNLIALKETIAKLATQLQEDPENSVSSLSTLCEYATTSDSVMGYLAIGALVPVFKSLAPSYQIRPLSEAEKKEKVSKEVAKSRRYEQSFVKNYRIFITHLAALCKGLLTTKGLPEGKHLLAVTALKASCELCASSLRHFNFNVDLFSIPIRALGRKPVEKEAIEQFTLCVRTVEMLLNDDSESGAISFEIFRLLSEKIKKQAFNIDESVLNIFLSASVLNDFDANRAYHEDGDNFKRDKRKRIHLSKKQRKARKDAKEIEEDLRKAENAITVQQREKFQASILKMLFKLYLEILQSSLSGSKSARLLIGSVLEGLSRFGPMANIELVGDFLEVLKEVLREIINEHSLEDYGTAKGLYQPEDVRTILLCIATSFALISNHSENGKLPFSVDLSQFVSTLYKVLCDISLDPDLELSSKSLRLTDPLAEHTEGEKPAVNVSTRSELLVKCLDLIFFRSMSGSKDRALLFLKRIYMMTLQTPEKTTNANLKFISKLMSRYGDYLGSVWSTDEKIGEEAPSSLGYEVHSEENMVHADAHGAVLWENLLLEKHYCLATCKMAKALGRVGR